MRSCLPAHVRQLREYLLQPSERNEDLALSYFRSLYPKDFKRQADAANADGYVPGHFVLEVKGDQKDWYQGLFQAIAYERSQLSFSLVVVCAKGFLAIWDKADIPSGIRDAILKESCAASTIGRKYARLHASKRVSILRSALWYRPEIGGDLFTRTDKAFSSLMRSFERSLKAHRRVREAITLSNFVSKLSSMRAYFDPKTPIKAVRAFYTMIHGPWDDSSTLTLNHRLDDRATIGGVEISSLVESKRVGFKEFVEQHCVHLRNGENVDDFFSRYDEALDAVDKGFRVKNGIFFTDLDLSRFAMWLVKRQSGLPALGRNYLVVDPACGSGNLVTNWRSPLDLRHKVVSEIEPELLYAVEQRMRGDQWHNGRFTVVPRTQENRGLNFLDISASDYLGVLKKYLGEKGQKPNKPIAFLCNPPYRSDDDQSAEAITYTVHQSIVDLIGVDAAAERYCCFLAQMKMICEQAEESGIPNDSVLLLFTKSSWLTRRPVFSKLRREILGSFEDLGGVLVNSKEFFDVSGRFPVAFTMWRYRGKAANLDPEREVRLVDLTWMKRAAISGIDWTIPRASDTACEALMSATKASRVSLGDTRQSIREAFGVRMLPDFKRNRRKAEVGRAAATGLPRGDQRNSNKKAYGEVDGRWIGFMDDLTPCRISKATVSAPYFYLESRFMRVRSARCFSGPPDKYGYVATSLDLTNKLFLWFSLGRTFASCGYPLWADALELWAPDSAGKQYKRALRYAYAIGFAENECVETTLPAGNPVPGAPAISIFNPLNPLNSSSHWCRHMKGSFNIERGDTPARLVGAVNELYRLWQKEFRIRKEMVASYQRPYFVEKGYLSPGSGVVQIRDHASQTQAHALMDSVLRVQELLKETREEFFQLVTSRTGLNYFGSSPRRRASIQDMARPSLAI